MELFHKSLMTKKERKHFFLQEYICGWHFHGDIFDLFDIQTMPDSNEYPVYLIQVKSGSFKLSNTKDLIYYNDLCEFTTPDSIKKELHIWQKGAKLPIILPC